MIDHMAPEPENPMRHRADPARGLDRRAFLVASGGLALAGFVRMPVMAGPFGPGDIDPTHPIPLDKKLRRAWVRSLTERGEPLVYRGPDQLRFVGMPVGGIGAGTVYLGGDGKLWCWDIFNEPHLGCVPNQVAGREDASDLFGRAIRESDGANYVAPRGQWSPWNIEQGFVLRVGEGDTAPMWTLGQDFRDVEFRPEHPIGCVRYADPDCPVRIDLESFSPFIPLDADRSSYPACVMRFTLTNTGDARVRASLAGWMENPALGSSAPADAQRVNGTWRSESASGFSGWSAPIPPPDHSRPDILFDDFEHPDWGTWRAEGRSFEGGPYTREQLAPYQDVRGEQGRRFVNAHNWRLGGLDVTEADNLTGSLISPEFVIRRNCINFRIGGGGGHPEECYLEVVVGDERIAKATGAQTNEVSPRSLDVSAFQGKRARIRIVDRGRGAWGNLLVDDIVFSDQPVSDGPIESLRDFGSIAMAVFGANGQANASSRIESLFAAQSERAESPIGGQLIGSAWSDVALEPGQSAEVCFLIAWHFPNLSLPGLATQDARRGYADRFTDARAVVDEVAANLDELTRLTRAWRDCWYEGTLPRWFLMRTLATACDLQTNTCFRLTGGRFWGWEGIGCCAGTCTHVWHYAQAVGRLFPSLERDLRERTDFGTAFREADGFIDFRGGLAGRDATDGQAGVILRTLREHQMSADDGFLRRVWPHCRRAMEFLIAQDARDGEPDGIPVGEQHNTLDAEWYGKVPQLASLYIAALAAAEQMAQDVGDGAFAERCRIIRERGAVSIGGLFDAEKGYYVQIEDPAHLDAIGIGAGCYIDQVMGQWWASQLGLGRLYDQGEIQAALSSLWDYNFCPDMALVRDSIPQPQLRGRPYALAGDAGLVMCTWPKGGRRDDWQRHWQYGYFNECMSGFEYQAAGHMIWESAWRPELLEKGLAVCRAIHDRYDPSMRNPFNEIECSDHYARAMASYGAFIAICGFEHHGPRGHLGFAPRLRPEAFRAAFTAATAWGQIAQRRENNRQVNEIDVRYGSLRLRTLAFEPPAEITPEASFVWAGDSLLTSHWEQRGTRIEITLNEELTLAAGDRLTVEMQF